MDVCTCILLRTVEWCENGNGCTMNYWPLLYAKLAICCSTATSVYPHIYEGVRIVNDIQSLRTHKVQIILNKPT